MLVVEVERALLRQALCVYDNKRAFCAELVRVVCGSDVGYRPIVVLEVVSIRQKLSNQLHALQSNFVEEPCHLLVVVAFNVVVEVALVWMHTLVGFHALLVHQS